MLIARRRECVCLKIYINGVVTMFEPFHGPSFIVCCFVSSNVGKAGKIIPAFPIVTLQIN